MGGGTTPLKVNFTLQEKIKFLGEPYMASLVLSIRGAIANLKSMRCQKLTYEDIFYRQVKTRSGGGNEDLRLPDASGTMVQFSPQDVSNRKITGFPTRWSQYCTGELKRSALTDSRYLSNGEIGVRNSKREFSESPNTTGGINIVQYLGIAADEPERIARHQQKENIRLPLVEIGWDEAYCRQWCEENDLLSPIYTTATRGGCWFCHNQGVEQLRLLRKNYPDLWALLLKWDADSPTTFKPDGHTVHDFDKRFELEDKGVIDTKKRFYWKYIK